MRQEAPPRRGTMPCGGQHGVHRKGAEWLPYLRIDFNLAFRTASCGLTGAPSSQRWS
jgi:hypothetical protein